MQFSAEYEAALEESKRHHASSKTFSGKLLRPHAEYVKEIIQKLGVTSILDYGAGKGEQYSWINFRNGLTLEQDWGVQVQKYDPAWPPYAAEPVGTFDLVICTHTLGSIPIVDLPLVIERLHALANKAVFIAEKIGEVRKHVFADRTKMPIGWNSMQWLDAIAPHRRDGIETHLSVRYKSAHGSFTGRFRLTT